VDVAFAHVFRPLEFGWAKTNVPEGSSVLS
jgi:hypothetical protein